MTGSSAWAFECYTLKHTHTNTKTIKKERVTTSVHTEEEGWLRNMNTGRDGSLEDQVWRLLQSPQLHIASSKGTS